MAAVGFEPPTAHSESDTLPPSHRTPLYLRVMHPKDAEEIANSVDSDQTAPLAAVRSGSALFAQAYLSKNLVSLR